MPKLIFDTKEILVDGEAVVNASGNIYIENGRKYRGKKVCWVILRDEGSETPIVPKMTLTALKCDVSTGYFVPLRRGCVKEQNKRGLNDR